MRPMFLVASFFFISACDDGSFDTDLGTESESESESDTETETETEAIEPCLQFHGVHSANSRWVYRWHNPNRTGSRGVSVFSYDPDNHEATLKTEDSWSQSNGQARYSSTTYDEYACDNDGLYHLKRTVTYFQNIAGNVSEGTRTTVYTDPAYLRPNEPGLGDSWVSRTVGETTDENGQVAKFDNTARYGVTQGDIGVSGGFTALKIETPEGNYYYWQQGVGTVYFNSIAWLNEHIK